MAAIDILTDKAIKAAIKSATEAGKPRKLSDGGGLVLEAQARLRKGPYVTKALSKSTT